MLQYRQQKMTERRIRTTPELNPEARFSQSVLAINNILSQSPHVKEGIHEVWNRLTESDDTKPLKQSTQSAILHGTALALSATNIDALQGIVTDTIMSNTRLAKYEGVPTLFEQLQTTRDIYTETYEKRRLSRARKADALWEAISHVAPLLAKIEIAKENREEAQPLERYQFVEVLSGVALRAFKKHCSSGRIEDFPAAAFTLSPR